MGAFKALSNDLATSANQEIIIAQNATIEAEINETTENTRELKRIKDLTKDTNKILTKIYN
jgi:glycerol-3-phosphate dehydrogenase